MVWLQMAAMGAGCFDICITLLSLGSADGDAEFAREEIAELEGQISALETKLKLLLLPKDPLDERDVMLEIR